MSRCVFGSQRSLDETGTPLGPMTVRTVTEVAVTSWTDSERRSWLKDEEDDEEESDDERSLAADEDDEEEEEEEEDAELVLLVEAELAEEEARGRTTREVSVSGVVVLGPACCKGRAAEAVDDGTPRGESDLVTAGDAVEVIAAAAADADAATATGRLVDEAGRLSALATMTPFSATTS